MKTTEELLNDMREASERHEGFSWVPLRPADVTLALKTIRVLQSQLQAAASRVCHCERASDFNLVSHLSQPSRVSPLAAAAAVNMMKTKEA